MPYCRECGSSVSLNDAFCNSCGNELDFTTPSNSEVDDETKPLEDTSQIEEPVEESVDETEEVTEVSEEHIDTPEGVAEPEQDESPSSLGLFSKILAVICVPIAAAGIILEILSVLSLATGGYTTGEFVIAFLIFGVVAVVPSAYLYHIYKRIKKIRRDN